MLQPAETEPAAGDRTDKAAAFDYQGYLTTRTFWSESVMAFVKFDTNGRYFLEERYTGSLSGSYALQGNKVTLYPVMSAGADTYAYNGLQSDLDKLGLTERSRPPVWTIDPDYADLHFQGALWGPGGMRLQTFTDSPAGKTYTFRGAACVKTPIRDEKNERYISIKENLKMRRTPSLAGEVVHLPYYIPDIAMIDDRTLVFQDDIFLVRAKTVKRDTIDGITAPWYLFVEVGDGLNDNPQTEWVWVFGGYVIEFGEAELKSYRAIRARRLRENIRRSGYTVKD